MHLTPLEYFHGFSQYAGVNSKYFQYIAQENIFD